MVFGDFQQSSMSADDKASVRGRFSNANLWSLALDPNSACPCRLLGHDIEAAALRAELPARLSAPGLPELNHSQATAVRAVLQSPLSLIQGAAAAQCCAADLCDNQTKRRRQMSVALHMHTPIQPEVKE